LSLRQEMGLLFPSDSKKEGLRRHRIRPASSPERRSGPGFFAYPTTEQFDTIIGNPPYVRFQDVAVDTKKKLKSQLFDSRSNLFLFFIEKCVRHLKPGGELIFIVPREFIKLTAAKKLNAWLYAQGSITHFTKPATSESSMGNAELRHFPLRKRPLRPPHGR
jgi:adenine-specific DNA methylase